METKNEMTEAESFGIIQQMITQAKEQYSNKSFMYLLWGWLVFAASLTHYLLANAGYEAPYIAWLLMPVGAVISVYHGRKQGKERMVRTYVDEAFRYVVTAFLVSLCIVLIFMGKLQLYCYPVLLIVYGVFLFTTGGLLHFKPLMAGGFANWALAIAAFYADFNTQLLLLAVAVLAGYIIPGYMLRNRQSGVSA